jgi:hypothetical protein
MIRNTAHGPRGFGLFSLTVGLLPACLGGGEDGGTTTLAGADAGAGGSSAPTGGTPAGEGGRPWGGGGTPTGGSGEGGLPWGLGGTPAGQGGQPAGGAPVPGGAGGDPGPVGGDPGTGGFEPVDCGSGFSNGPRQWSLPFSLEDQGGLSGRSHLVMDMTGDGIIDLLIYEPSIMPMPDARVGRAYWLVYEGGASGFADIPLRFTLPFSLDEIDAVGQFSNESFLVTDLTGDRRPDFVVIRPEGDPAGDARISRAWWVLYPNTGTGFSPEGTRLALPYPLDESWQSAAFTSRHHVVMSLDGAPVPDFVEYRNGEAPSNEPRLGKAFWHVYPHTGFGWASEPARFTLPFDLTDENRSGDRTDPATNAHVLLALRGPASDFRPEFVVTSDEERPSDDARLGRARWDVYTNDGAGFGSLGLPFTLPFPLVDAPGAYAGGFGSSAHTVLELTGDGLPDLLVHREGVSPDEDARLGRAHWLVYPGTGEGFSEAPIRWTLPVPLVIDGSDAPSAPGTGSHALLPLGERCLSLLFTDDTELPEADPRVGRGYWLYFPPE